jgi:DNA-binding MarR family transcriptional regulator
MAPRKSTAKKSAMAMVVGPDPMPQAGNMAEALTHIRKFSPYMSVIQTIILFQIAANPGISHRELCKKTKLYEVNVTRATSFFAGDLVDVTTISNNYRENMFYLSENGRKLLKEVLAEMGVS